MKTIDLHVHSSCSDGTMTPRELTGYAIKKGLSAYALTDHDTTAGLSEAIAAARGTSLEVIPGIEFSTEYHGRDIHIVGLDIAFEDPYFQTQLARFQDSRRIRNDKMIRKLAEHGVDISGRQMREVFGSAVWTRAHFARYLMEHGYVRDMPQAFETYIGDACPCFVPREKVTPAQAVRLISETGGIPVLAHPMLYRLSEAELNTLLKELKAAGLLGVEALYSTHSPDDERLVRHLARAHGLLISGGSDFHGSNKPHIDLGSGLGTLTVPQTVLEELRKARAER